MNKYYLSIILAGSLLVGCVQESVNFNNPDPSTDAIAVDAKLHAALFHCSATWCAPTGNYGYPTLHQFLDWNGDPPLHLVNVPLNQSTLMPVFYDSVWQMASITSFITKLAPYGGYFPSYNLNSDLIGYGNIGYSKIEQAILALKNQYSDVGIGLNVKAIGRAISWDAAVEFFEAPEQDATYGISVIMLENEVDAMQNSTSGYEENTHYYVLRTSLLGDNQGQQEDFEMLDVSTASKGDRILVSNVFSLDEYSQEQKNNNKLSVWDYKQENSSVLGIVWKKDAASTYEILNTVKVSVD